MSAEWIEFFNVIFRFTHVVAAIMWIGNSLLFTWMEVNLIKDPKNPKTIGSMNMLHAGGVYYMEKRIIDPESIPERLHRFKWQAYMTWISGFTLLVMTFYTRSGTLLIDPAKTDIAGWQASLISLGSIVGAWLLYDFCWKSGLRKKPALAIGLLTVAFFVYAYWVNGLFNGRFVYLQLGAMLATTMSANVFFIITPNQKKMMDDLIAGKPQNMELSYQAKMRSLTNNYVTFPVIFLMLSAHFPMLYGNEYSLIIMGIIVVALVIIKHMMNIYNDFAGWLHVSIATGVVGIASVVGIVYFSNLPPSASGAEAPAEVDRVALAGKKVFGEKGCMACHQPVASSIAPTLVNIYGQERTFVSGETAIADEAYLRESILNPNSQIVKGYAAAMPSFKGVLTEEEVEQLIAYIKAGGK